MKMKIKNKIRISSLLIILALAFTACEAGLVTDDSEGSGDSSSSGFSFSDLYTKISTLEDKISELQLQNTGMGGNMNDLMAPVGSIVAWHKTLGSVSIPAGWVECNGQPISDTGGPYDGTDAPNLNGEGRFLRGSFTSGYLQDDAFQGHLMNMVLERGKSIEGFPHNVSGTRDLNSGPGVGRTSGIVSDGVNGAPRIDSETRPVNMSVVWIMRIK